ncbi:UNVERIFIED_ORG: hypothetical protein ABIB52_002264 [Arthrobacter sp. UYCu721]
MSVLTPFKAGFSTRQAIKWKCLNGADNHSPLQPKGESILRGDWKFFAALSGVALILGGLTFATSAALAGAMGGNPEMVEMLTAYSAYGY